jgi:hypothetical protein
MRGLKYRPNTGTRFSNVVALFMDVWIEIPSGYFEKRLSDVALFMSAWIEILDALRLPQRS